MIIIGADHGGFALKEGICGYLKGKGTGYEDVGAHTPDDVDYQDIAYEVCKGILEGRAEKGILLCGTGMGMSMMANGVRGIRAALCASSFTARLSRTHNDSNVLVMGGRTLALEFAVDILEAWLGAEFLGGKYARRAEAAARLVEGLNGGKP
ncbi:MAG: ribose 5-phosphate isomerase B [Oscillospiraceae bacterium]|nr:ribose 5-phosphate isomerase B [Oscillospiraceae bacterium]